MGSSTLREDFERDGYAIVRNFYDIEQIESIQSGIKTAIQLIARRAGIKISCETASDAMQAGIMELIRSDRTLGAEVYDAVKQIPAFLRLVSDESNSKLMEDIRRDSLPGIAAGGYGIRMDLPGEEKYRAFWHQEFPAQLRSIDGVVFWTPLVPITKELGPVEICAGSHRGGLIAVDDDEGGVGRSGAYALRLRDEERLISTYERVAPLTNPGDLILMDFLTLHQSGVNVSSVPRWSIQFRYFNFLDPVGVSIGWKGSFAERVDFRSVVNRVLEGS